MENLKAGLTDSGGPYLALGTTVFGHSALGASHQLLLPVNVNNLTSGNKNQTWEKEENIEQHMGAGVFGSLHLDGPLRFRFLC